MTRVLFVLGYLGSGKTTFVKNFLSRHTGKNAVLVNDFGAEDVDGILLEGSAEKVESIFNGSVFCSCRSEKFVETMIRLSEENFDNILVETSGLANPFQMRKLFDYINGKVTNQFSFAGAVCIADAANIEKVLYTLNTVKMQIAAADVILINKTDLAVEETRLTVQKVKVSFKREISLEQLRRISVSLAPFCHRIKGVIEREDGYTVYEFSDGTEKHVKTQKAGNFLILLSACKFSLRKKASEILEQEGVEFTIC